MILVDSSVWIDFLRGTDSPQVDRLDAALGVEAVAIGDLMLVEVLQGIDRQSDFDDPLALLDRLMLVDIGGREVAVQAAMHFRVLRTLGITVRKTIDSLIATRCIIDDLPLLYADRDFDPFVVHCGLRSAMTLPA